LGGSDPQHYIWAACSLKTRCFIVQPGVLVRGLSLRAGVRNSFFSGESARALGERDAYL
jgi:hypothetical protein